MIKLLEWQHIRKSALANPEPKSRAFDRVPKSADPRPHETEAYILWLNPEYRSGILETISSEEIRPW